MTIDTSDGFEKTEPLESDLDYVNQATSLDDDAGRVPARNATSKVASSLEVLRRDRGAGDVLRGIHRAEHVLLLARRYFSNEEDTLATVKGQSVESITEQLRDGTLDPSDVPIDLYVKDGTTYILDTKSATALTNAGIPRSE